MMAIYPLHCASMWSGFRGELSAVSGSGARAIVELEQPIQAFVENRPMKSEVYPHPIAFNVLPRSMYPRNPLHEGEMKNARRGPPLMHHPKFCTISTCVVCRSIVHTLLPSMRVYRADFSYRAHEVWRRPDDGLPTSRYRHPILWQVKITAKWAGIRRTARSTTPAFWVSGDQLLKGAALNAVQIAELL